MTAHSHCHACGSRYTDADATTWPRKCRSCGNMTWRNPLPVVVALVPVSYTNPAGIVIRDNPRLLGVERKLSPNGMALPGGFVDYGETWQEAAAREVKEETGIVLSAAAASLYTAESAPDGTLLLFAVFPALLEESLDFTFESNETKNIKVLEMGDAKQLVFDLHAKVAQEWIMQNRPAGSQYWGEDESGKAIFTFPM